VLVELSWVEQRYKAVMEVLDGATVVDVARRDGVARQTVHDWLRCYAAHGLAGLADGSPKPQSCPHQMAPAVEAAILELRRAHPGWGPRTTAIAWSATAWSPYRVACRSIDGECDTKRASGRSKRRVTRSVPITCASCRHEDEAATHCLDPASRIRPASFVYPCLSSVDGGSGARQWTTLGKLATLPS
jgi:transposase-like protein